MGGIAISLIQQITIRSGDVLDSIQVNDLPPIGGTGGGEAMFTIADGDYLQSVTVTSGWYTKNLVVKVTFTTAQGVVHGPFGTGAGAIKLESVTTAAPEGCQISGFDGTTVSIVQANGPATDVVATLVPQFAPLPLVVSPPK